MRVSVSSMRKVVASDHTNARPYAPPERVPLRLPSSAYSAVPEPRRVDAIRFTELDLHVALVADVAVGADVASHVVRVHGVPAQCDRARGRVVYDCALRDDGLPDHPPRLAHVNLVRPVTGVGELILRQ